jgi:hypothetical protein
MMSRMPKRFDALLIVGLLLIASLFAANASAAEPAAPQRFERGEFNFSYGPRPAWVEVQPIAESWPEDAPGATGASWRNWLIDAQVNRRGDTPVDYYEHVIEATTAALVPSVAKFEIGFNPLYQQLTLHHIELRRDGQWLDRFEPERITLARREGEFESNMATGTVSTLIVVADVRPGDVVRYAYSLAGENPVLTGMTHDEFTLAWVDPILLRNLRVELPAGVEPETRLLGSAAAAVVKREAGGSSVRWQQRNLAALQNEDETPNWYAQYPTLQVSARRSWSEVERWATELYPPQQALPAELEARIEEWRGLDSPELRAAAALQVIQDEVRYFSVLMGESTHRPAPPTTTWERRFGDCKDKAWLLASVLNRLDIEAVPALVSVGRGRAVEQGIAAASQFDHVIVRARIDGNTLWLDPTLTEQRGPLQMRQAGNYSPALTIGAGADALQPMTETDAAGGERSIRERFVIDAETRQIRMEIETRLSGSAADSRRRELSASHVSEMEREFADYYRRLHGELTVAEPLRIEDDPQTGVLRMHEAYLLHKPWANETPAARAFELYADGLSAYLQLSGTQQRKHPLWRPHPITIEQTSEVVLPPGWTVSSVPDGIEAGDASFSYSRTARREDQRLVVAQRFSSAEDHVPADQASRHLEVRRKAMNGVGTRLIFNLPQTDARSDRNRRLRELLGKPGN